jgi:hypothetical protein
MRPFSLKKKKMEEVGTQDWWPSVVSIDESWNWHKLLESHLGFSPRSSCLCRHDDHLSAVSLQQTALT